jgi:hypothetical protein
MTLVGVLLVSGLGLVLVESVGYLRGGFNSEFWSLPLEGKLDGVAAQQWAWWWVSGWSLLGLVTIGAGTAGLAGLLAENGEVVLGAVALGAYLVGLIAWVLGQITQAAVVSRAAVRRSDSGETPDWIQPLWDAAYLAEGVWVITANLAYAVFGVAIASSGLTTAWVGWAAMGLGLSIVTLVVVLRDGFPQLALLVPAFVGIALLVSG